MKIVPLGSKTSIHSFNDNGMRVYDHPNHNDLEIGDIVHYKTGDGIKTFVVESVVPADLVDYDSALRIADLIPLRPQKEKSMFEEEYATAKWRTGRTVGRTFMLCEELKPVRQTLLSA